jgi:flagellar biosynthesis GTPase FlhF
MNAPLPLSVTLTMDADTAATLAQDEMAVETARAYVIDSPDMAELANGELRSVILRKKRLKELKDGFVAPAKQILENAANLFNPALEALADAESILKSALTVWTTAQKQLADEARRKQEAEERERRQKAEAEAAAERARAEEKAREEQRKAEDAAAAAEKARAEGNAKEAAKQAALAAKASEAAVAAVETGNVKAAEKLISAEAAMPAPVAAPAKVAGFGTRENWVAELAPGFDEAGALVDIVLAISAGRRDLLALVKLDMSAANKLAKAQKKLFSVPGLVSKDRPVAASRAA